MMKKTKFALLFAVLCTVGAGNVMADPISDVSQLSNAKAYTIHTARGYWTLNTAGTGIASSHKTNGTVENADADQTDAAKRFAIVQYQGFYYAYNLKLGGFLHYDGTGTKLSPLMGTPLYFVASGDNSYPLRAATLAHDRYVNNNNSGSIAIDTWTYTDSGNKLDIEEVGDLTTEETTAMEVALASSPMNPHKAFVIAADRGTWCANAAGTSLATTATNTSPATGYNQFAFVRFDNNLYIYNVGTKKFIKKDGSLKEGRGDAINVRLSGDATYPYMFYFTDGNIYFNMQGGGGSYAMNGYNDPDEGNRQSLTVQDVDPYNDAQTEYNKKVQVTYNLKYNGEQVLTTTVEEGVGANAVLPASHDKGIFTYTYDPTYNQPGSTTITVTATPIFTISPDYVGATWYNMYIRQNDRWVGYNKGADDSTPEPYKPYAATDEDKATKELQWAFVGNPFTTGIKVINRAAGRNMSLTKDGSNAVMREGETYWDIFGRSGGILLREHGTDNNFINQAGGSNGSFQFWNSSYARGDNGSTMWLVEAPVTKTTVTYNVKYNGETVKTATAEAVVDDPTPLTNLPADILLGGYVEVTGDDTHNVVANDAIELTATWKGPFKFSPSFDNAVWYYANLRGTKYLRADENNKDDDGRYKTSTTNEQTDVYKWAFMGNPYSVQILNKGAGSGKYLYMDDSSVPVMTEINPATNEKARWIVAPNGTGFCVRNESGNTNYINDLSGNGNLGIWNSGYGATNEGSRWAVEEIPHQVTFNILYGGNIVATETDVNQNLYEAPSVPAFYARDFVNFTYDVETITYATTTVNATATWTGPFVLANDYASAHWYDMAVRSTWYVTSDNIEDGGALKTVNANALGLAENAYQWAFVGDPWHIKLYNKAEGSSKVYAWTSDANATIPAFTEAASTNYWKIRKSTNSNAAYANAFLLTIPSSNHQVNQFGGEGGSLKIWTSDGTHDAGSAFTVFDVPDDFATYVASEISPYFETTAQYFVLNDAAKTDIGYNESYKTSCPFATYKAMKQTLLAKLEDESNFKYPETGYYRIKSNYYPTYFMAYRDFEGGPKLGSVTDATSPTSVVKLTSTTTPRQYMISVAGLYASTPVTSAKIGLVESSVAFNAKRTNVGITAFEADGSDRSIHCANTQDYYNVGWTYNAAASEWQLEDATSINVSLSASDGHTYATLYVPFGVTLPNDGGVDAYTVEINGNWAKTTNIGKNIPAGTPVILRGEAETNTSVTATINDGATADVSGNALSGSFIEKTLGENDLILGISSTSGIGFYKKSSGTLSANRAYLPLGNSSVKSFTLTFDDATGIASHLTVNPAADKSYDLSGRQVKVGTQKGIFISNGKKMLVK